MKITELTQKSHSEQLSEDRNKLDEGFWAPVTAAAGAGLSYYDLASRFGSYDPRDWTDEQRNEAYATVAADAALGATGVGLAGLVGKAGLKFGSRGVRKALNTAKKNKADAEAELKNATPTKTKLQRDSEEYMKKQGKPVPKTQAELDAKNKLDAADADLRVAQSAYDAKVPPPSGIIGKTGKTVKFAGKSIGLGAAANYASDKVRGEKITDPADVPILGKDINKGAPPENNKGTPPANNNPFDNSTFKPSTLTGKDLADRARKLRGY